VKATKAHAASVLLAAGTSFVACTADLMLVEGTLADSAFVEAASMLAVVALVVVGKRAAAVA